jgi:hypothetical protein
MQVIDCDLFFFCAGNTYKTRASGGHVGYSHASRVYVCARTARTRRTKRVPMRVSAVSRLPAHVAQNAQCPHMADRARARLIFFLFPKRKGSCWMTVEQPETCSFREFADVLHCRPSWVTALRQAGRLVLTEDGKRVKTRESLQLVEETKDPAKAAVAARHAAERQQQTIAEPIADEETSDEPTPAPQSGEFQRHRAERESWAAKQARLDYERAAGQLLDAAAVDATAANAVTNFRKALESWPDTIAPQAVGKSEEQINQLIATECDHVLAELAREFSHLAKAGTV